MLREAGSCRGPVIATGVYWRAERLWPGATVVCIGAGPSLTREDVDHCRGKARVIAINKSWDLAPWADCFYSADAKWWKHRDGEPEFHGLKVAVEDEPLPDGVNRMRYDPNAEPGLQRDPGWLAYGSNSGHQAINLAYHLGASRILLLGYDMQFTDGRVHWHGNHPSPLANPSPVLLDNWLKDFPTLARDLESEGVEVLNCSRSTALACFARADIREVL